MVGLHACEVPLGGNPGRFTLAALVTKTGPSGCWLSKEELFLC